MQKKGLRGIYLKYLEMNNLFKWGMIIGLLNQDMDNNQLMVEF